MSYHFNRQRQMWTATIEVKRGVKKLIGMFNTKAEAIMAFEKAKKEKLGKEVKNENRNKT